MTISETAAETTAGSTAGTRAYDRRWWVLAVLCLSLLMVFVANTSLNVALPTLSRQLDATESQLQWVVAAYSLVFAGFLFTAGALGDRFGRKGALQCGMVIFFVACAMASQATGIWEIIGCRALMGAGAAFIMPSTLSIIVNVFPAEERAKAIAIWAGTVGISGSLGTLAGGFLLAHFWFGSIFLINLPIVAIAFVGGWFLVPTSRDPREAKLDPMGALLSIVGIGALVYGIIEAPDKGWLAPITLGVLGFAALVLAAFVVWELHTDEPMLDISFFRNPSFSTGSGGMTLVFLSMFGLLFLMTQYLQLVLGFSPLGAAVRMLPMTPVILITAVLTPRLSARFGANTVVAVGMLLMAAGSALFTQLGLHTALWVLYAALVPASAGMALSMSPMTAAIMSAVPSRRAGAGSAMNDATRELGAALGVAVLGSVAASRYSSALHDAITKLPAPARAGASTSIAGALQVAHSLAGAPGRALTFAARTAFVDGVHVASLLGAVLAVIAAIATYRYLPRHIVPQAVEESLDSTESVAEPGTDGGPTVFAEDPRVVDRA